MWKCAAQTPLPQVRPSAWVWSTGGRASPSPLSSWSGSVSLTESCLHPQPCCATAAGGMKTQPSQSRGIPNSTTSCLVGWACLSFQHLLLPRPSSFCIVCTRFILLSIGIALTLTGLGSLGGCFRGSVMPVRSGGKFDKLFEE